ncbi:MAG: molecular chaperone TorD family protein, partial [Rhodospirillales bacterium]|nr:molecular chaperone TorD family protein [Rhodospirillales bacterium]
LATLKDLEGDGSHIGRTLQSLAASARNATPETVEEEYNALFIGMGTGGELYPYLSRYLTGFLHEKPLARLRSDMAALGIAASGDVGEPEDHMAALCEIMHGLIAGSFGDPTPIEVQHKFFDAHLAPWAITFFEDLENAKSSDFYRSVGTIGRLFMAVEAEAFEMAA